MSLGRATIGNIRILSPIGHGGMGDVYLGLDEKLQRKVALKSIRAERRLDAAAQARFAREARILSQLDHPHICRVHDYITTPEADVIVLEYIEGRPLTALLRNTTVLPLAQKQRIAEQIARALMAAHERGVVHRDLKPGNVMVMPSGDVKVVDFGLAMTPDAVPNAAPPPADVPPASASPPAPSPVDSNAVTVVDNPQDSASHTATSPSCDPTNLASSLVATQTDAPPPSPDLEKILLMEGIDPGPVSFRTQAGMLLGTPFYMSPEQARGEAATPASDMFAFGLVLQEIFTGTLPHPPGLELAEIIARVAEGKTEPPGPAPRALLTLINRLKTSAPAVRPTALDALERLRWIRTRPRRRAIRLATTMALVVLALAGVKYTLDVRGARDRANRHRAQAEDLIGFMLGDLREKLEPMGKLALLAGTGDKALAYFTALPPGEVTDDDRYRQARALMQVGQVRLAEGKSEAAQSLFQQALESTRNLTARAPNQLAWQAALGAAHFWNGYIHFNEGRLDEALAEFREYLSVAQHLVAREPENSEWQMELAQAQNNLGTVFKAKGELAKAVQEFRSAVATKQGLVNRDPSRAEWLKELADSESWLGDALRATGDHAGAVRMFHANGANLDRLRRIDPENRQWQYLAVISHEKAALVLRLSQDLEGATAASEAARDLALGLTAHDPTNVDWRRELATSLVGLGRAQLARRAVPEACATLEESVTVFASVGRADPESADYRRQLAAAQALLSRAYEANGRLSDALRLADDGRRSLDPISQNRDRSTQRRSTEVSLARARALIRLGQPEAAQDDIAHAVAASAAFGTGTLDPDLLALRAEALLRAGRKDDAASLLEELARQNVAYAELNELRTGTVRQQDAR